MSSSDMVLFLSLFNHAGDHPDWPAGVDARVFARVIGRSEAMCCRPTLAATLARRKLQDQSNGKGTTGGSVEVPTPPGLHDE